MHLQPHILTDKEALEIFRKMAKGKGTPRRSGSGKPIIKTTLVTPMAMAVEQAKAELRRKGEQIPGEKKKRSVQKKKITGEKKRTVQKGKTTRRQ